MSTDYRAIRLSSFEGRIKTENLKGAKGVGAIPISFLGIYKIQKFN